MSAFALFSLGHRPSLIGSGATAILIPLFVSNESKDPQTIFLE